MQKLYPCSQSDLAALDSLFASFHESFAAAARCGQASGSLIRRFAKLKVVLRHVGMI
jgi:hypothetical protein